MCPFGQYSIQDDLSTKTTWPTPLVTKECFYIFLSRCRLSEARSRKNLSFPTWMSWHIFFFFWKCEFYLNSSHGVFFLLIPTRLSTENRVMDSRASNKFLFFDFQGTLWYLGSILKDFLFHLRGHTLNWCPGCQQRKVDQTINQLTALQI